jgi:kelch motif-containing protein
MLYTTVALPSGKVLVAGGITQNNAATSTSELYDPGANAWSFTGSVVSEIDVSVLLNSGEVLATTREATRRLPHTFNSNGPDGAFPTVGLVPDGAGNLYGTTKYGGNSRIPCFGSNGGCGAVFRLTP